MNAIITGASGIGRAIAIAYVREGANVVINYVSEDADAVTPTDLVAIAISTVTVYAVVLL